LLLDSNQLPNKLYQALGKHIYHLNIGQPDIETPPSALKAVKETDMKVLAYSHSAGFESYRRKLVGYYEKFGISVDHNDIIITTGGSEAILFTMMACLDPGDEVIIPEPFYANYNSFSQTGGIIVTPITSYIENDFALPSIAEFEKRITPKTKAILICNPSNPTGYLYSREELMALKEIAIKHDLFLFTDEVYREFCYDGKEYNSLLTIDGLENHVVVIDSISKRFSACGARIGMIVSKNKSVISTAMKFAQARLSPPTFAQILAEATLDVPQSFIDTCITEYNERRELLIGRLQQMEAVVCPKPTGAFYAFAKLPIDNADRFCQWLLEEFEHNGASVMLAPGTGFYYSEGLGQQEVRMAYVLNKDDINKAMDCLQEALQVYPGRTVDKSVESLQG